MVAPMVWGQGHWPTRLGKRMMPPPSSSLMTIGARWSGSRPRSERNVAGRLLGAVAPKRMKPPYPWAAASRRLARLVACAETTTVSRTT